MEQDEEGGNNGNPSFPSMRHEIRGENGQPSAAAARTEARRIGAIPPEENTLNGFHGDSSTLSEKETISSQSIPAPVGAGSSIPPRAFQIHVARAVDPLIGEIFVCPNTLEALCLHRMLGLPLSFIWERFPSPSLSLRGGRPYIQSWWPLSSTGPALPAAVDPRTGIVLSGSSLIEALRSCVNLKGLAPKLNGAACCEKESAARLHAGSAAAVATDGEVENDKHLCKDPLCNGTCETCTCAAFERATEFATTELVQKAVQVALRFYMWKDEAMFRRFTRPMIQNSLGYLYGSYYCWAVRYSMGGSTATCSSSRLSPEDLKQQFPNFEESGTNTQDALTVEELLAIDGLRRAFRVVEQQLQGKAFLGGATANALDATVFAHLAILFSLPFPDRRELQRVLLNASSLLQYCRRVQETYQIWPPASSFLFGVSSLSEMVRGAPLRVHSWRQQRGSSHRGGYEEETEGSNGGQARMFRWWLGSAACCAAILVASGKTPFALMRNRPSRSRE